MFRRVVVGVSGGVDSAVSAYLLKKQGFEVCGAFMKNWDLIDESGYCSGEQDWEDAQRLCRQLEIPLEQINFVKDYWLEVFGESRNRNEEPEKARMFRRVVVGVSGGVDSAVSAYLLKKQGFEVCGAFMKNWDLIDESGYCSGEQDWEDAQRLCRQLEIPLEQINFVKDYWLEVFGSFLKDYDAGITPNPDILCNRHIKFNRFYHHARERMNADAIATGHYAQTNFGPFLENYSPHERVRLYMAPDLIKDQTFFLSQITAETLRRTMFPIGGLTKPQVKRLASEVGLDAYARKKESMGICFVGKRSFQQFIAEYIDTKPGPFVDVDSGRIVGQHAGLHHWTVGQKCKIGGCLQPYYVQRKHHDTNVIDVVSGHDHPLLFTDILYTEDPVWINVPPGLEQGQVVRCFFRFQHTKPLVGCTIFQSSVAHKGQLLVKLDHPLRAITPGQYAVFYRNEECFGSARIVQPAPGPL